MDQEVLEGISLAGLLVAPDFRPPVTVDWTVYQELLPTLSIVEYFHSFETLPQQTYLN